MPSCVLRYCTNQSGITNKCDGITFHKIPRPGQEKREAWIKFIQKNRSEETWLPSTHTVICSAHFKKEDKYITKSGLTRLKKTAVPCEDAAPTKKDVEEPLSGSTEDTSTLDPSIVKTETLEELGTSIDADKQIDPLDTGCESPSGLSDIGSDDLEGALDTPLITQLKQQLQQMKKQLAQKDNQLKQRDEELKERDNQLKEKEKEINSLAVANSRLRLKNRNIKQILLKLKMKLIEVSRPAKRRKSEDSNEK